MFNSLTGIITGKYPQKLFLTTHGIEWDLTVPETTNDALPPVGKEAQVYTWLQHTDTAMLLFGFAASADRDLFFDLLKVDGVGPKSAVKIMSSIVRSQLIAALDSGDLAALERIPGLGKKTAAKMLLQLKGKLTLDDALPAGAGRQVRQSPYADVITALSNMGYDRRDVEDVIIRLTDELTAAPADPVSGDSTPFAAKTRDAQEEILFRRAIVELAQ
jgi:holliday junction DNA helicase RuvA